MAFLLSTTAVAIASFAAVASASTDPSATYTITPSSGSGGEPVTISGPNVGEVEFVFFKNLLAVPQPLGPNEVQVYAPGGLSGNVEVKLQFVGESDVIVSGGFTYVEGSAPGPSEQPGSGTTVVEPPLAETGASTTRLGTLAAAALVVSGASVLLLVTRSRRRT